MGQLHWEDLLAGEGIPVGVVVEDILVEVGIHNLEVVGVGTRIPVVEGSLVGVDNHTLAEEGSPVELAEGGIPAGEGTHNPEAAGEDSHILVGEGSLAGVGSHKAHSEGLVGESRHP